MKQKIHLYGDFIDGNGKQLYSVDLWYPERYDEMIYFTPAIKNEIEFDVLKTKIRVILKVTVTVRFRGVLEVWKENGEQ